MGRTESDLMWMTPRVLEVDEPYEQYRARMINSGSPKNIGKTKPSNLTMQVKMDTNWRTPAAQESGISIDRLEGDLGKRMYDKETGRNAQYGLSQQVKMDKNWPTPNTPSGGSKADGSAPQGTNGGGKGHREMMKGEFNPEAKLNPSWGESLMGLPKDHTQLSTATDPNDNRIDRLRLLGNGVVPQTAEKAFRTLLERFLN